MELQSEKLDDLIQKNEDEMRKLQDRNNKLKKKQQEQEKKEHEKWLGMLDKILTKEYGSRYPKTLEPEDILDACKILMEQKASPGHEKGVEETYEDNTENEHCREG